MDPAPQNSSIEEKSSSEDKELALAFNRREKGAYDAIYFRYSPRVQSVCRRMLNDPHDAQEASQEAFLRVYQALPRFNGRYQLGAWITRITTNVCLDQLRSKGRRPVDLTPAEELEDGQLANEVDEPEAWVLRKAESNRVRKVLEAMPPMHRAAIVLRDFEGLSYEEVAVALDISECQVKALIHRARKNFKRSWSPLNVAGLFPVRWFRRSDLPAADRAAEVARSATPLADAAASVTHAASSCSMALQQCGQFLTERFATVVTTATITTVAVGSAASGLVQPASSPERPLRESAVTVSVGAAAPKGAVARKHRPPITAPKPTTTQPHASPTSSPQPAQTPTSGQNEGTPTPSATPTPAAPSTTGSRGNAPTPSPSPTPFTVALGFGSGAPIAASPPESHHTTVDCRSNSVDQELTGTFHENDSRSYSADLALSVGSGASIDLTLYRDWRSFSYNGGASSVTASRSGDTLTLSFTGSYGWYGSYDPGSANLSQSGRFQARLTVDCATSRVVTLSVVF